MSDIRKWFVKQHDKNGASAANPAKAATPAKPPPAVKKELEKAVPSEEISGRRKTSKYFATEIQNVKDKEKGELSAKRKLAKGSEELDDDFVTTSKKDTTEVTPTKRHKTGSGRAISKKQVVVSDSDEEKAPLKSAGKGQASRGSSRGQADMDIDESHEEEDDNKTKSSKNGSARGRGRGGSIAGRGRGGGGGGGGRGGFGNFGERKDPPHKGEKEVPEGAPECLAGLTFVISGTLDSLEREEAEDLIKRHGGRVTGSVSKKTNYLLCDEDIGGRKSEEAKELGTGFLTEDGLFDMIRSSNKGKPKGDSHKSVTKAVVSPSKKTPQKEEPNATIMNNKEKPAEKAPRPQLVKLDKALKLAEKWVSEMSKTSDNGSTEVELEGRPTRLGLGAIVPRQPDMGPVNDPVERKLRASLGMGKRKANESIEKAMDENDVEGDDENEEDDNLDSRTNLFAKKKLVQPLNPTLQVAKKKKSFGSCG